MKSWDEYIPGSERLWGRIVLVLLLILALVILTETGWTAETYPVPLYLGVQPDSVRYNLYKDTTVSWTAKIAGSIFGTGYTATFSLLDDTLYTVLCKVYWTGADSADGAVFMRDLRMSSGTRKWRTPYYWSWPSDSARIYYYINGAQIGTAKRASTTRSYDTTWSMTDGQAAMTWLYIYPSGSAYPLSWTMQSYFDTTGAATESPANPDLAYLEGYVYWPDGNRVYGATVLAKRTKGTLAADTSGGSAVMYMPMSNTEPTDTTGYFQIALVRTTSYSDTTQGFYDIVVSFANETIAEIKKVRIPASGNVNLGNIIAER